MCKCAVASKGDTVPIERAQLQKKCRKQNNRKKGHFLQIRRQNMARYLAGAAVSSGIVFSSRHNSLGRLQLRPVLAGCDLHLLGIMHINVQ